MPATFLDRLREDFPRTTAEHQPSEVAGLDLFEDRPGFTAIYMLGADGSRYPARDVDMSDHNHGCRCVNSWTAKYPPGSVRDFRVDGTSLVRAIDVDFLDLVSVFGAPEIIPADDCGDGKVDAEWIVEFDDCIATIYNFKSGQNYNGKDAPPVDQLRRWHIGGHSQLSADRVTARLQEAGRPFTSLGAY